MSPKGTAEGEEETYQEPRPESGHPLKAVKRALRRLEVLLQADVVFDAPDPLPDLILLGERDALFRELVNVAADVTEARAHLHGELVEVAAQGRNVAFKSGYPLIERGDASLKGIEPGVHIVEPASDHLGELFKLLVLEIRDGHNGIVHGACVATTLAAAAAPCCSARSNAAAGQDADAGIPLRSSPNALRPRRCCRSKRRDYSPPLDL